MTGRHHRSIVSPFALYFNVQLVFFKFQVQQTRPASIPGGGVRCSPGATADACRAARALPNCRIPLTPQPSWSALVQPTTLGRPVCQVWRIFTNFFFFGSIGLDFFFHMFFLVRYCRLLEEGCFRGRTADFLYMILFGDSRYSQGVHKRTNAFTEQPASPPQQLGYGPRGR
jgi:hypothetical protein